MAHRYNSFGAYLKERFGSIVYKVNVDAGFTCPNRDGNLGITGCIYCNNDSFRPSRCNPSIPIKQQIKNGINYLSRRYKAKKFIAYFQPFTNTYAAVSELEAFYKEALSDSSVIGLAIGTRPDCIDEEKLTMLQTLAKDYFVLIEYGLQSIYDKSLEFIKRGHNYQTFLNALELTKDRGIHICVHIIVGLPTETKEETILMADEISCLPIRFLKIHQLQVIKNTPLEKIFEERHFATFLYEEYLDFLINFIERLSPNIILQRLFAISPDNILIVPKWNKSRQEIIRDIERRFEEKNAFQGSKCIYHRH